MTKLLVVFGATGNQGGSIVNFVLQDPELSKAYKVRGVTRDVSKPAAQTLQAKGVEMVAGDVDDVAGLSAVLRDADTVFFLTGAAMPPVSLEQEIAQGKAVTDAAIAAGAQYLIYSTLPRCSAVSGGKYTGVVHFDVKADVEDNIRKAPIKSAFFAPGSFMSNFASALKPRPNGDGTYSMTNCVKSTAQLPLIDTVGDTGKYVGAILAAPEKFEGQTICGASKLYSLGEMVQIMSEKTGKTVVYKELPPEVMEGFMPHGRGKELVEMMQYHQEIGYYGPRTAEMIAQAAKDARGQVTSFEEFLTRSPLLLD